MKTIEISIFSFNELNEDAKQTAIMKHGQFLDSLPIEYENEAGELICEYVEHSEIEIIENIEANEYLFFNNGELVNAVTYCGDHPKKGITEINVFGQTKQYKY